MEVVIRAQAQFQQDSGDRDRRIVAEEYEHREELENKGRETLADGGGEGDTSKTSRADSGQQHPVGTKI